ncbi:MAG: ferredoxin [Desulfobacterales bacterium]|nr:ferredoxin [Desulfobacterales bacterium]MBF0395797.1 ferredoxin [Desulfobacterales bacterium]
MADKNKKYIENIAGKYYVSDGCVGCSLCSEITPHNFRKNEEEEYSFICKQPETQDEEDLCKEAMDACPATAIGNDGNL